MGHGICLLGIRTTLVAQPTIPMYLLLRVYAVALLGTLWN